MLTNAQQQKVRDLCRRNQLGMIQFQDNGLVHFTKNEPIREAIQKTFPDFEVVDFGSAPWMDTRTDDTRQVYWVTLRPEVSD